VVLGDGAVGEDHQVPGIENATGVVPDGTLRQLGPTLTNDTATVAVIADGASRHSESSSDGLVYPGTMFGRTTVIVRNSAVGER
jgi:hypothetical protein